MGWYCMLIGISPIRIYHYWMVIYLYIMPLIINSDSLNVTNIVADIFNIDGIEYTTKTNNDVLMYNSVLGKFENRQLKNINHE